MLSNPKHERFAQSLADGKSAAEAYNTAGYAPNRHNAATLARKQHVLTRVAELLAQRETFHAQSTAKAVEAAALTKEWVINTLRQNVERAMTAEPVKRDGVETGEYRYDGAVANRALELLGKELGMFIDRKEVRTGALDDLNADDRAKLRDALNRELERRAPGTRPAGQSEPSRDVSSVH